MENETIENIQNFENENTTNETKDNEDLLQYVVVDRYENTENSTEINEATTEVVQENNVNDEIMIEKLDVIHEDLGFICSFLIIFTIIGLLHYIYKFFNMFFKY